MPTLDEAIVFSLTVLRQRAQAGQLGVGNQNYGYDVYAPNLARAWAIHERVEERERDRRALEASSAFFAALWELCRRGLLRPGVHETGAQGLNDGGGYCVTEYGRTWLEQADEGHFISLQPGALAAAFGRFQARFGDAYGQRTQEAIKCRNAEAWLATCTMVGAAAESILLAIAIAKTADEERVMREYQARNGRNTITNLIIGQAPDNLARPFRSGMNLLSYWRDNAGHGLVASISSPEAEQALRELLSLSQFSFDRWSDLVGA
jgi:hypothetical protein